MADIPNETPDVSSGGGPSGGSSGVGSGSGNIMNKAADMGASRVVNKAYQQRQQEEAKAEKAAAEQHAVPRGQSSEASKVLREEERAEQEKVEGSAKTEQAVGKAAEKYGGKAGAAVGGGVQGAVVGGVVSGAGAIAQEHGAGKVKDKRYEQQMDNLSSPTVSDGAHAAIQQEELEEAHKKEKQFRQLKAVGHVVSATAKGAVDGASGGGASGAPGVDAAALGGNNGLTPEGSSDDSSAAAGVAVAAGAVVGAKALSSDKGSGFSDISDKPGGSGDGPGDKPDKSGSSGGGDGPDGPDDGGDKGKGKGKEKSESGDKDKGDKSEDSEKEGKDGKDKQDDKSDEDKEGKGPDLKTTAKVASAANTVHKIMLAAKAMEALKMFLMMMAQLLQAAAAAVAGAIAAVVNAVMAVAGMIATAIGVTVAVAVAGIFGLIALVVVVAVVLVVSYSNTTAAQRDGVFQCDSDETTLMDIGNVGGDTMANAKKVYDVFTAYGMANENIAGVLGNWEHESGIDPTGVETIYTEPFTIGEKKMAAWQEDDFLFRDENVRIGTRSNGAPLYALTGMADRWTSVENYANRFPGIIRCGIGLGQWTNARNQMLLDYAAGIGQITAQDEFGNLVAVEAEWYMLDVQLAFMLSPSGDSRHTFFENWDTEPNPESAAKTFQTQWEGISYNEVRGQTAAKWFIMIGEWEADLEYGNSIISLAGATIQDANEAAKTQGMNGCSSTTKPDNSTAAAAAVAYAWPTNADGIGNDGTDLYRCIHDLVFPGDTWYQSCDRSVATAIRWSGTDDSMPAGACSNQLAYMLSSSKWTKVQTGNVDPNNLLPGDILIRSDSQVGHIVMYVGNAAIKAKYPDAPDNYCIVSGSLRERSPGCGVFYTSSASGSGLNTYTVFRNVQKEATSQFRALTCPGRSGTAYTGDDFSSPYDHHNH